jgi:type II secretory pathway component PulF
MPLYRFTAVGRDGNTLKGEEIAADEAALERRLKARKLVVTRIRPARQARVPEKAVTALIGQLATLVESGVTIDRALQITAEDTGDKRVATMANRLRADIKKGHALSQALGALGRLDPLIIPLVQAGEASGQLAGVLGTLQSHFESRAALRRDVAGALAYPSVLVVASLLSLVALGLYVIPTFKGLFENNMDAVPGATRAVFAFSDFLIDAGPTVGGGIAGLVLIAAFLYRSRPEVRDAVHASILRVPLVGPFIAKMDAGNLMGVLGVLLKNGVSLAPALGLSAGTLRNQALRKAVEDALAAVRRGRTLTAALKPVPAFPRLAQRLVAVGEETGRLDAACGRAGNKLQEEVRGSLKGAVRILEPLIILVMGGAVGFIVIAMLLAVYSLTEF